ncbi:MAG: hypothetical protein WDA72_13360 [Desulfomonilia bacterium]|jgi:hypothetical protein|nr:hypothetical protein [Deltaproteobacteria bacterium]HPX19878.1 hypothetical protein [Deltaproteobacteria bacterium]
MEEQGRISDIERKRHKWAERIRECIESGKSQAQYCREQGLNIKVFYYWKRKQKQEQEAGVRLIPVGRIGMCGAVSHDAPLVLITGRYRVEVGKGFDAATLVQLIHTLERV